MNLKIKIARFLLVSLTVFSFLFLGVLVSVAATTHLGNNISTTGNLVVDGALKFTSGAANNYVLTSDISGNATWVSINSILGGSSTDSLPEGITNKYFSVSNIDQEIDSRISSQRGAENGIAPLDGDSLVPMSNLPTGTPNGLATLDGSGQISPGQIPSFTLSHTYTVADLAARDALTPATGDVAVVIDAGDGQSVSYIWDGADWVELLTPLNLYLEKGNNLADLTDPAAARNNLGLGADSSPTFTGLTLTTYADFTPITAPTYSEGRIFYDSDKKTLSYYNDQEGSIVDLGREGPLEFTTIQEVLLVQVMLFMSVVFLMIHQRLSLL